MKWLGMMIVLLLLGGSWMLFEKSGHEIDVLQKKLEQVKEEGDPDSEVPAIEGKIQSAEGEKVFNGILLAIFSAAFVGIVFVVFVMPNLVGKVTESVFGSGEKVEEGEASHEAHALLARGDFEGAIAAFKEAAAAEPLNRSPWMEIVKIQRKNLEDPAAAIESLKEAMAAQEWEADDKAFFLFRLSEIYNEDVENREMAVSTLRRVVDEFPETRHSASARHKLRDWGMG